MLRHNIFIDQPAFDSSSIQKYSACLEVHCFSVNEHGQKHLSVGLYCCISRSVYPVAWVFGWQFHGRFWVIRCAIPRKEEMKDDSRAELQHTFSRCMTCLFPTKIPGFWFFGVVLKMLLAILANYIKCVSPAMTVYYPAPLKQHWCILLFP